MEEFVPFMSKNQSAYIRQVAVQTLLELSANGPGREMIMETDDCINSLLSMTEDDDSEVVRLAVQTLVNISSDDKCSEKLLSLSSNTAYLTRLVRNAVCDSDVTEVSCQALSNLTRTTSGCERVWEAIESEGVQLNTLLAPLLSDRSNINHIAHVICNLSQHDNVRRLLLDKNADHIKQLLNFTSYPHSTIRRKGIVGTIRNCCFDTGSHEWLLSEEIDIISKLALPLAGPEEFDEDINDKLPLDLQYLGDDKQRESDPEIRKMLIEAINQLCATKFGRTYIKEKEIYCILRELHKWETVDDVIVACENLVDILISDEPGKEFENLKEVEVPPKLQERFRKMDEEMNS